MSSHIDKKILWKISALLTIFCFLSLQNVSAVEVEEYPHCGLPLISQNPNITVSLLQISTETIDVVINGNIRFTVYYEITGSNRVTHEYAQAVANAAKKAWRELISNPPQGQSSFDVPPDTHIDIIIQDLDWISPYTLGAVVDGTWSDSTLNLMTGERLVLEPGEDLVILIDTDHSALWTNGYLSQPNVERIDVTVGHEFFHTIQTGYRHNIVGVFSGKD